MSILVMKQNNHISMNEFIPLLNKIPKSKYKELSNFVGVKNVSDAFKATSVNIEKYRKLQDYYKHFQATNFSFVGRPVEFDELQRKEYYTQLTNLINSKDFQKLNQNQKNDIVEEQKHIYKQLINK